MKTRNEKPFALNGSPSFGSMIRGARLGYHWSDKHGCFIRIGGDGPPWEIRLAPNGGIPARTSTEHYRVWWEDENANDILLMVEPLRNVRGVKRPIMFFVDDEGRSLSSKAA